MDEADAGGAGRRPVSDRDREYLRRIGEYERQVEEEYLREYLALSLEERLQRSWEISRGTRHVEPDPPEDADVFYVRARALGKIIR